MAQGYNNKGYGAQHRSRKRRRKQSNTPVLLGLGAVVILVIIAGIFLLKGCRASDVTETTEEETTEAVDTSRIQSDAVIDLNAVITSSSGIEDDNRINIKGMNREEIKAAVLDKYSWSMKLTNSDARVGDVVKPKVDIDETTEAATLGDPENPDSAVTSTEETTESEITVGNSVDVPDFIAEKLDALIDEIFADDSEALLSQAAAESAAKESAAADNSDKSKSKSKEAASDSEGSDGSGDGESGGEGDSDADGSASTAKVYTLTLDNLDDSIESIAKYASDMWYVEPLGGSIGSYDSSTDTFVMENSREGFTPDKDKLISDIKAAVSAKEYDKTIAVTGETVSAESSSNISGAYKTIATFTTKTTANAVRNKNIELACKKINGTIVRPGEEFSFNNTVGQRTKEAGFGEAAAYNNGEVVQEVGGGVCQVSTTLYNAVLKAGLKTTARQSHTFKPTYVTPGMDATVSWGGPDYKFANVPNKAEYSYSSSYAIGIRASYSNQTVTVSIYGRPVLKEGYSFSLDSTQTKTIDMVRKLIEPGSDKEPTTGTEGSVWEVRLVIKKDGEVISNNVDHNALYSGHIEYYTEETTAAESESESESESETETDEPLGPGEQSGPGGSSSSSGVIGPGDTGSGPTSETTAHSTTAAPTQETSASSGSSGSNSYGSAPGEVSGGSDASQGPVISNDGPGSLGGSSDSGSTGGPGA